MSISKLRNRRPILARQAHVKSTNEFIDEDGSITTGAVAGVSRATATIDVVENANNTGKQIMSPTATAKLPNAAAINAAVVGAATVATVNAKQQQQQQLQNTKIQQTAQTILPQTSLLKIEPFVPSLTTRLQRRPFGRSFSTLSSTNIKTNTNKTKTTLTTITSAKHSSGRHKSKQSNSCIADALNSPLLGAAIDSRLDKANATNIRTAIVAPLRRNPVRATINRQRSKSSSSSASNRIKSTGKRDLSPNMPLTIAGATDVVYRVNGDRDAGGNNHNTINGPNFTLEPNGVCRIIRTAEEREKQPDRINYDRRGLSAIPIFENETQLRLLSLQHNLINIFHIPREEQEQISPTHTLSLQPSSSATKLQQISSVAIVANDSLNATDAQLECGAKHSPSPTQQTGNANERIAVERIAGAGDSAHATGIGGVGINAGARLKLTLTTTPARQFHNNSLTPPPPPPTPLVQMQQILPKPPATQIYQQLLQQRLTAIATNNNNNNVIKNLHFNAPLLPLPRQSTPCRFALKRNANIPRYLQSIQKNMLKTQLACSKLTATATTGVETRLKCVDLSSNASAISTTNTNPDTSTTSLLSTSTLATTITTTTYESNRTLSSNITNSSGADCRFDDDPLQQLAVKNRQLVASYGMIFQHLVFLDLYDNQIERIGNLDSLPALTVLLLGKNRITDIGGLHSLRQTLRVLDLHGNKISNIAYKLNQLHELKSLNLAGNMLRQIGEQDFKGLEELRELNLKRNKIKRIYGFEYLTALERLWLCHNELHRVDDMASIAEATNLQEITIDNNPVSLAGDCVSFLVSHLPNLQSLTQMCITEQVRAAAMSWRRNKEISDMHYAQLTPDAYQSIKREEVISNARTNWELLRSQQMVNKQTSKQLYQQQQLHGNMLTTPRIAKPTELSRINESSEAMGEEGSGSQEHVKLPPIEKQQEKVRGGHIEMRHHTETIPKSGHMPLTKYNPVVKETPPKTTSVHNLQQPKNLNSNDNRETSNSDHNNNRECLSGSSNSSLGANVHSSSSCFSSDNEDSAEFKLQRQATRIHKYQKTMKEEQHQCHEVVGERKDHKNAITRNINDSTDPKRRQNGACNDAPSVNTNDQTANETTNLVTITSDESILDANSLTTKQTTNDVNPNITVHIPPREEGEEKVYTSAAAVSNDQKSKSNETNNCQVKDNNSSILIPNCASAVSNKTMMPHQKLTSTVISNDVNGTTNIINHQNGNGTLTLCPSLQTLPQQITNNLGGSGSVGVGNVTTRTRTTRHRLMRSQTVVNVITSSNSSSSTTANSTSDTVNSGGNETVGGGSDGGSITNGYRRVTNNQTKTTGQANTQPTVTCIVAPTPLNTTTSGSNNYLLGAGTRTTVISKAERDAREREKEKEREREREREQGGDYLIEICGRYLNIYGQGALRYIDKQWNAAKAQDVHTLNFSYINFNNIAATVLARIKTRFPNAENFVFRETNIEYIGQLNALAELQGITTLTIDPEGNAITTKDFWREYAIFRLSHWGLKLINGVAVEEAEIEASNEMYESLADLVLLAMPATMLQPLLARLRLDETCTASKMSPKEWLMKAENKSFRLVVGKEALQWKKPTTTSSTSNSTGNGQNNHNINNNTNNDNGNVIRSHQLQTMTYTEGGTCSVSNNSTVSNANTNPNININALSMRERGRLYFTNMLDNTFNAVEKLGMLETLWPSMLLDIVRNALLDYSHLDEYLRTVMEEIMK